MFCAVILKMREGMDLDLKSRKGLNARRLRFRLKLKGLSLTKRNAYRNFLKNIFSVFLSVTISIIFTKLKLQLNVFILCYLEIINAFKMQPI